MSSVIATPLVLLAVIIYMAILGAFKKFCLNKINSGIIRYILGMVLAYGILFGLLWLSRNYEIVMTTLQHAVIRSHASGAALPASMLLIIVPAFYSVFLLGYTDKRDQKASWGLTLLAMASLLFNGLFAFFGLIFADFLLNGHSFAELVQTFQESLAYIDWRFMPPLGLCILLFILLARHEFNKSNKSDLK